MSDELTVQHKDFNAIITKAGDPNNLTFKTIDEKALVEINEWMPEVNKKVAAFQKQNSQTTSSLMSLNMIDAGPYRVLRQILAQVEKKRSALKENLYNLEKSKLKHQELSEKDDLSPLEHLEMKKMECDIIDAQGPIEAALKELGALKRRYEEICKNKKIPINWDEEDFENAEIEHHIKSMFRNAIRDKLQGSCNIGTMEYFEQYGINPITAYAIVDGYIATVQQMIHKQNVGPGIESHYQFLDSMYERFKDSYKIAAERIGLNSIVSSDFLMKEVN